MEVEASCQAMAGLLSVTAPAILWTLHAVWWDDVPSVCPRGVTRVLQKLFTCVTNCRGAVHMWAADQALASRDGASFRRAPEHVRLILACSEWTKALVGKPRGNPNRQFANFSRHVGCSLKGNPTETHHFKHFKELFRETPL